MAAIHLVTDLALRIVDQDLALAAFDEHHEERHQRPPATTMMIAANALIEPFDTRLNSPTSAARQTCCDTGKNDDRDTVAQAAFGDLLAQPHQEHGTGQQRHDGDEAERHARIDHQARLRLERRPR